MKRMARAAARSGRARLGVERLDDRLNPSAIFAVGANPGSAPVVTVFDSASKTQLFTINAYDKTFTGGVNVAVGDVNGDGSPDVITGTGVGGGPLVKVFDGHDGTLLESFTVGDAKSHAGVTVATADYDKDGKADVVAGSVQGGKPLVEVLSGATQAVLHQYTPFAGTSTPFVAAGDTNGDGTPDTIIGSGSGAAPRVTVFSGADDSVLHDFFAFEQKFVGGVQVAAGDLNGDGKADIVAAAGKTGGPRVQVFDGGTGAVLLNFFAYDSKQRGGVKASAYDSDGDGQLDVVTIDGTTLSNLQAFNGKTGAALTSPAFAGAPVGASFDTVAPAVTFTSSASSSTKTSPISFTATFNEIVNGFTADDLIVTNGTASNFVAVDGKTFTFDVTPTAEGDVTVAVAAGAATDAGGNASEAATFKRTYDKTAPTVTAPALTTNDTTPTLTGTVSEKATVSVTAAGQTVTAAVSGTTWTATLPASVANGTYDIKVTATDPAGNVGTATTTGGLIVDTSAITTTITAPSAVTNSNTILFTVKFSAPVTGFTASGLTVSNGTVTGVSSSDNITWVATVTPTAEGEVSANVTANAAKNAAGTGNAASNTAKITYDKTAPTVAFTSLTTNDSTPTLTGSVNDASATVKVSVGSQTVTATISGTTWSATLPTALTDGTYTVNVTATDPAGNAGTATSTGGLIVDTAKPTVAVSTTATNPTAVSPIPFVVTFNESVTGFTASDVTVTNGSVANFADANNGVFTFNVVPSATGTVGVTVNAGVASDKAGNTNAAATPKTLTFNGTAIGASMTTTAGTLTNAATIPVTLTFTSAVKTFNGSVIAVNNGNVSGGVQTSDNKTFTFNVVPTADGPVAVNVPAGATSDALGNPTSPANLVVTYDHTPPTAAVSAPYPTGASTVTFTVAFNEAVPSLPANQLTAMNGTLGAVTKVDAKTYTVVVTPTGAGPITLTVMTNGVTDAAGNSNIASFTGTATPGKDAAGLSLTIPDVNAAGWTTAADGLKTRDVTTGTGPAVTAGQKITVEYTLWLTDGTQVQTSVGGTGPFTATLSTANLIQGWVEGVPGMKPGGIRDLFVPAALGYGSQSKPGIPANSDLIFEIKLISIG